MYIVLLPLFHFLSTAFISHRAEKHIVQKGISVPKQLDIVSEKYQAAPEPK